MKDEGRLTTDQAINLLKQWAAEAFMENLDERAKALREAAFRLRTAEIESRKKANS